MAKDTSQKVLEEVLKDNMKFEQLPNIQYPNPYLRVNDFVMLSGAWDFSFSKEKEIPSKFENKIIVPFTYETKLSGINNQKPHSSMWYHRKFNIKQHHGRIILHFGAVDYSCVVFINGIKAGTHKGGYTSFFFDITSYVHEGDNNIAIHVKESLSKSHLSGKQRRKKTSYECWYTQSSGIWKDVYLEYIGKDFIKNIKISADKDGEVCVELLANKEKTRRIELYQGNKLVYSFIAKQNVFSFKIMNPLLWSIKEPNLYELKVISDYEVSTSFGFRSVEAKEDGIHLNGERIYLRAILDQGYWKDSLITPPSKKALFDDIALTMEMGFNAIRKHQKIEENYFYYICDCLGVLTTLEIPSPYCFNKTMRSEFETTLKQVNNQLFNSPSVFSWLLINESWGVYKIHDDNEQQQFVKDMTALAKNINKNRLAIANDGWNQMEETDIASFHEYQQNGQLFKEKYLTKDKILNEDKINTFGPLFAKNNSYHNQPIVCSECGGVSVSKEGWGYGEKAAKEDLLKRISDIINAIYELDYISGFCLTQLTDVEQETNGLLTNDRKPKANLDDIKKVIKGEKE